MHRTKHQEKGDSNKGDPFTRTHKRLNTDFNTNLRERKQESGGKKPHLISLVLWEGRKYRLGLFLK